MGEVHIPNNWAPREYQQPVWDYLLRGIRSGVANGFQGLGPRALCVWHRRAGKDAVAVNVAAMASQLRPGNYAHILPTYRQANKVVWSGKNREGEPVMSAFPRQLFTRPPREDEMTVWLSTPSEADRYEKLKLPVPPNAGTEPGVSQWQALGSDNYDSLRGANLVGVVFSEYAWQDPKAWEVVSPMLAENGGWAMFISTPCGMNHFHKLYELAKTDPHWFCQMLTVNDTKRPDGTPVMGEDVLEQDRRSMPKSKFEQEYHCSFNAGMEGAYYAADLSDALEDTPCRITDVPWERSLEVWTWWDLGMGDATAIWFVQHIHGKLAVIDYLEDSGKGLGYYAKRLKELPYCYGGHIFPHDVQVRELGTGKSRKEVAESLGLRPITVAPKLSIEDGVEAVRTILPRCFFDMTKCARGLDALRQYRTEYQDDKDTFRPKPTHDWTSHAADAFRYGALTVRRQQPRPMRPVRIVSSVIG